MTQKVPPPAASSQPIIRLADKLAAGDRIATGFLPDGEPAEVVFVQPYRLTGRRWTLIVCLLGDGYPEAHYFTADSPIPLSATGDASGMGFGREPGTGEAAEVAVPADVEGHAEFSPRGDRSVPLIGRTQAELLTGARSSVSEPSKHYVKETWANGPGQCGVECACGIGYGGFDTLAEAGAVLDAHIADPEPVACPGCGHALGQHDEDGCCRVCHCHPDCTDRTF